MFSDQKFINYIQSYVLNKENNKEEIDKKKNRLDDPVNKYDDTILHYAVFHKREKLIIFLLEHGASPYIPNKRKQNAFDIAKKNGLTELIEKHCKVPK